MRRWRYRPLQAAVVAALAALMAACVAFAPLYFRSMQQALTELTLGHAPVVSTSVQLAVTPSDGLDEAPVPPPEEVADRLPADLRGDFQQPVLGYEAPATVPADAGASQVGELVWRGDQCAHLRVTDGSCPRAAGEILVSAADVENFGWAVGDRLWITGRGTLNAEGPAVRLRVVGVYAQEASDRWFGQSLTGRSGLVAERPTQVQHDVWLTARPTFEDPATPVDVRTSSAGFLLDQSAVGVDELLHLGPAVDRLAHDPAEPGAAPLEVVSDLPDLAAGVASQIDQSRVTVPLLMAQLCLLSVVVLWLVLLALTEQRRPEVALARLRGRGRRGARRLLLAELLPVTLAAVVPGGLLALCADTLARRWLLPGHAPFELTWSFLAALLLAAVVLVGVTVLASARIAREPVEQLLRRVPPRRTGWALGATEAVVIAGAGGIVVVFATGGLEGPAVLAAPGLLAIVVGLLLAHLTTPVAAALGRRRLHRGRVRSGVSLLEAARSPATRRIIAMVTLASALTVFSADALVVGARNRASAAEQQAGAPAVLSVTGTELAAMRAAVAEVDPDGERLTPVVRVTPPADSAPPTLAVVPASFREIALFPGGTAEPQAWARLEPPDTAPIDVTGDELALTITDATLTSVRVDGEPHPVTLGLDLVTPRGETLHTRFGELAGAAERARFVQRVSCTEGCHVTGIWADTLPGAVIRGRVTLGPLVARPSGAAVPLGPAGEWTAYDDPTAGTVTPRSTSPERLTVVFRGRGASPMTMQQRWLPGFVPALVAGPLPPGAVGARFTLVGLDGEEQQAARVGSLDRVPASPPNAFVADLDLMQRGRAVWPMDRLEVWSADDDPALLSRVEAALAARGLAVSGTTTLADVRRTYDESAAAWSLQLALLVGVAALLIALLVLVVSAVSGWRTRSRDLAALRMSGVPPASIRTMAVSAQLPAVLVGVAAGAAAGLAGARLAMPIVPLFADEPEVSTLDLDTAWGAVLVAVVAALVVLTAASVLVGRALASRARLQRLRETV